MSNKEFEKENARPMRRMPGGPGHGPGGPGGPGGGEKAKNFVSYEIEVVRFIVLCSNRERDSFFPRAKVGHFV